MKKETANQIEMESLNLDDLDIEGLERRLELAPTTVPPCPQDNGPPPDPGCPQDGGCVPLCSNDISWHC